MKKENIPKEIRKKLKFNTINLKECSDYFPVPASHIIDELRTHNQMIRQLTDIGLLKKYNGRNGYYTNKSFVSVKSFFEEFKEQNGRYPTFKALVVFCEVLIDK